MGAEQLPYRNVPSTRTESSVRSTRIAVIEFHSVLPETRQNSQQTSTPSDRSVQALQDRLDRMEATLQQLLQRLTPHLAPANQQAQPSMHLETRLENKINRAGKTSITPGSPEAQQFGEQLARLRAAANLTQDRLAYLAGITPGNVSKIERGRYVPPKIATVLRLGEALGLQTDQIAELIQLSGRLPKPLT